MTSEIFWEVSPALSEPDQALFFNVVNSFDHLTQKFPFFKNLKFPKPLKLNIIITDNSTIKTMNHDYRKKNKFTDVLTFPFDTEQAMATENIAEIYLSQDQALIQCKEHKMTLLEEFIILALHGLLHAFHFDHETSLSAKQEMQAYEKELLTFLGFGSLLPLIN